MKTLSLLKPNIKTGIMKNEHSEKYTFLEVPSDVGIKELKNDIKKGAVQFKVIEEIAQKENDAKYVVVVTNNLEFGYMGIAYLAACYNEKKGYTCPFEKNDEMRGIECWYENSFQIPIVSSYDLMRVNNTNNYQNPFSMGNFQMQGNSCAPIFRPYWLDCTENQICVEIKGNEGFYNPIWDDGLNVFKSNQRVYILVEQNEDSSGFGYFDDYEDENHMDDTCEEDDWYDDGSMDTIKYLTLNYAADELDIKLEKEHYKNYYRQVIKGFFDEYHIKVNKGFSYQKFVNIIIAMNDSNKCEMIDKIIKYAIKDMNKEEEKCLTNHHFDFIDKYVKSRVKNKNKVSSQIISSELVGMEYVKEQIYDIVNMMKYNKIRKSMNLNGSVYHNVHAMLGAPGTAKTTMARLMGQMMVEEGLLKDNRFVCVNGAELKGKYVGHSAPKTKALFDNYDIIVIDEAYSLVDSQGETDSFSNEAIAQLIIELEEHSTEKLVIFAGYGGKNVTDRNNKMIHFFDSNPGIKSRITSFIYFDSYSPKEMADIFYNMAKTQNFKVDESARKIIQSYFEKRVNDENFGNGREARSLLETCILFAAKRLFHKTEHKYTKNQMQTITYNDVSKAITRKEQANIDSVVCEKGKIGFC